MNNNYEYPYLKKISEIYDTNKSSENVYILACQHLLEPQEVMLDLISDFGVSKGNIRIFGKIYSTSIEIYEELVDNNFSVLKPNFDPLKSFDEQHYENCKKELIDFISIVKPNSRLIILDDGGELLKVVNDLFTMIPSNVSVFGIEQTSSGFRKLEDTKLKFPIFNVARSAIKLEQESPLIADLGCSRIIDVFEKYSIKFPRVLVVGLGPMGNSTYSILKEKGYPVYGYDILQHDEKEIINLIQEQELNIIIGATGKNIVNESQLEDIKNKVDEKIYLISMSSADREFPSVKIRERGILNKNVHGDVVWENIILINNGFPITFKGKRYESTPQEIEKTIGLLYASVLEAVVSKEILKNDFIEIPEKINKLLY